MVKKQIVYAAKFRTRRGTLRTYVGKTVNVVAREKALKNPGKYQPGWLKAGCADLVVTDAFQWCVFCWVWVLYFNSS